VQTCALPILCPHYRAKVLQSLPVRPYYDMRDYSVEIGQSHLSGAGSPCCNPADLLKVSLFCRQVAVVTLLLFSSPPAVMAHGGKVHSLYPLERCPHAQFYLLT